MKRGIICCTYIGAKFPEEYIDQWRFFIPTTITRNKANCNYVVTKAVERKNNDDDTKKKIMTIDDEGDITFTFKVGLEDTGLFTVDTFNDPRAALFRFKPGMYHLLLIDIRMPQMSGYELYKEIRKIDAEIKVIFLTASPFEDLQKVFPTFNKNYYILKPVEISELIKKVNSIIATNLSSVAPPLPEVVTKDDIGISNCLSVSHLVGFETSQFL